MNTTVLICSTDSFADSWPPALACLEKYWPDCPYVVRTLSNHKPWGKNPLLVGDDLGWVNNLKTALNQINTRLVLTFLDDMFLAREVDTAAVIESENPLLHVASNVGAIRLGQGCEELQTIIPGFIYHEIKWNSAYRISTSPTLWNKRYLEYILGNCGETAWDFEVLGSKHSQTIDTEVWALRQNDIDRPFRCYYTGITRGKWDSRCIAWLKSIGIEVEDTSRGFMPL